MIVNRLLVIVLRVIDYILNTFYSKQEIAELEKGLKGTKEI